jgi:hypothetical protein
MKTTRVEPFSQEDLLERTEEITSLLACAGSCLDCGQDYVQSKILTALDQHLHFQSDIRAEFARLHDLLSKAKTHKAAEWFYENYREVQPEPVAAE